MGGFFLWAVCSVITFLALRFIFSTSGPVDRYDYGMLVVLSMFGPVSLIALIIGGTFAAAVFALYAMINFIFPEEKDDG